VHHQDLEAHEYVHKTNKNKHLSLYSIDLFIDLSHRKILVTVSNPGYSKGQTPILIQSDENNKYFKAWCRLYYIIS